MADLPDDLERLKVIAAQQRDRLARTEARIRRLEDAQWREHQKERHAAISGTPRALDPNKVQICRVNPVAYDNGQPCACPVATCNLWRGGLRPAGVPVLAAVNPARDQGPCILCGVPWAKHGTAPTCASHDYTPAGTAGVDLGEEGKR